MYACRSEHPPSVNTLYVCMCANMCANPSLQVDKIRMPCGIICDCFESKDKASNL